MACQITETTLEPSGWFKLTFAWTSDANGSATGTTQKTYSGELGYVACFPGSAAPADGYDITLTDKLNLDLLTGQAQNIAQNTTALVAPAMPVTDSTLTLNVTNAGSSKTGTVIVYIKPFEILP